MALQGPASREVLQPLTAVDLDDIKYYWFAHGEVASARATISRTGYTGEDGFEIFVPPNMADRVWQALLESGRAADVIPCGLGARDTLRLEAGNAAVRQRHRRVDDRRSRQAWSGSSAGRRTFIGERRLREQKDKGVDAEAGRLRDDRSRHRAPRISGRRRLTSRLASSRAARRHRS